MQIISRKDGYVSVPPEDSTFSTLVVDLTHRCNMECANCYLPNRNIPDLALEPLFDVLTRLPKRTHIRLIGGEPTLRPDLPVIIQRIVKLRHRPFLLTNGLKLAHLDYCHELWTAGLRFVYISMNGADDDQVYRILDNGKYATLKTRALVNAFRTGFAIDTGTIVARGVNEHSIGRQIHVVVSSAQQAGVDFRTTRPWCKIPPLLRIKSIGAIGRHMEDKGYSLRELADCVGQAIEVDPEKILSKPVKSGMNRVEAIDDDSGNSALTFIDTDLGKIWIRLVDWTTNGQGIPDPQNANRGRLTKDFQIAPFFEDVKANEFGY